MRSWVLLASLALALPLAGCSTGGELPTSDVALGSSSASRTGSANATSATSSGTATGTGTAGPAGGGNATGNGTATGSRNPGNATGNATGNSTGNATGNATWTYDNRTGSLSGTGLFFNTPFTAEERFIVNNGTERLVLNLSVEGDELTLTVHPPGCDEGDCVSEVETADGAALLEFVAPLEGDWSATLSLDGLGPVSSDYTLGIHRLGGNVAQA